MLETPVTANSQGIEWPRLDKSTLRISVMAKTLLGNIVPCSRQDNFCAVVVVVFY